MPGANAPQELFIDSWYGLLATSTEGSTEGSFVPAFLSKQPLFGCCPLADGSCFLARTLKPYQAAMRPRGCDVAKWSTVTVSNPAAPCLAQFIWHRCLLGLAVEWC